MKVKITIEPVKVLPDRYIVSVKNLYVNKHIAGGYISGCKRKLHLGNIKYNKQEGAYTLVCEHDVLCQLLPEKGVLGKIKQGILTYVSLRNTNVKDKEISA